MMKQSKKKFKGSVEYELQVSFFEQTLLLNLLINEQKNDREFEARITNQNISEELKSSFRNVETIYQLFELENNFSIDIICGSIFLIQRSIRNNQLLEQKIKIPLRKIKFIKKQESGDAQAEVENVKLENEELKSRNKQLSLKIAYLEIQKSRQNYPSFSANVKHQEEDVQGESKEMEKFKAQFQKWKQFFKNRRERLLSFEEVQERRGIYRGQLQKFEKNGIGIYSWKFGGDRYEGEFKNDESNGKGIYYHKNNDRYEGQFKNYQMQGKGVYYFRDGSRYQGEWKEGKRHGKGTLYFREGGKKNTFFENGKEFTFLH